MHWRYQKSAYTCFRKRDVLIQFVLANDQVYCNYSAIHCTFISGIKCKEGYIASGLKYLGKLTNIMKRIQNKASKLQYH